MLPTGFFAVAIGVICLIVLAVISFNGPRDPGGRLPPNGGPIIPGPHGVDEVFHDGD